MKNNKKTKDKKETKRRITKIRKQRYNYKTPKQTIKNRKTRNKK